MYSDRIILQYKFHNWLLVALSASIPVSYLFSNYITGLLILNWLLIGSFKEKLKNISENRFYFATIAIFFVFVLGLIHTTNLAQGLKDLEHKLSLLIIPLVIFSSPAPGRRLLKYILNVFAASSVVISSIALFTGIYKYFNTGDINSLFYHQLSENVGMHAVYLSCYLVFSFFIILNIISFNNIKRFRSILFFIIEAYIVSLIVLLSSKTIIATFLLALALYVFVTFSKIKITLFRVTASLSVLIVIITALSLTPYTSGRFKEIFNTNFKVLNYDRFEYNTEFNGLSLRLLFWKFAWEINQRENSMLTGVGTGDSRDKLNGIYKDYNLYQGNSLIKGDTGYQNYNTHNQFVETYLKLGFLGLAYLLIYFVSIVFYSSYKKDYLFMIWVLTFIAFSLTESTLQVNKGIVFFSFFMSLFLKTANFKKLRESNIL